MGILESQTRSGGTAILLENVGCGNENQSIQLGNAKRVTDAIIHQTLRRKRLHLLTASFPKRLDWDLTSDREYHFPKYPQHVANRPWNWGCRRSVNFCVSGNDPSFRVHCSVPNIPLFNNVSTPVFGGLAERSYKTSSWFLSKLSTRKPTNYGCYALCPFTNGEMPPVHLSPGSCLCSSHGTFQVWIISRESTE